MVGGGASRFVVCLRCVYMRLYSKSVINDGSVQAHKSLSIDCDLFERLGVLGDIYYQPTEDDSFTSPPHAGLKIKINFICYVFFGFVGLKREIHDGQKVKPWI